MKKLFIFCVFSAIIAMSTLLLPAPVNAQNTVQCGSVTSGEFARQDEIHTYQISVNSDDILNIVIEETGTYSDVFFYLNFYDMNDRKIEDDSDRTLAHIKTVSLSNSGTYKIEIINGRANVISASSGTYNLYVDCVGSNGDVISSGRFIQSIQCGSIIESQFQQLEELHLYFLALSQNDRLAVTVEETGSYSDVHFFLYLYDPNGRELVDASDRDLAVIETEALSVSGIYEIKIINGRASVISASSGNYSLYIGCTRNGVTIQPGDVQSDTAGASFVGNTTSPDFSYGFPGVMSVDFSDAIEIPISGGQSQTGAFGSSGQDVFAYIYEVRANSSTTLSVSRVSGDIAIGVAVINQANNNVLYLGGMLSSDNLSVDLEFSSAGIYVIGVFRLDIAHTGQTGTSGAVEVRVD
jgi:hypothetical protein